MNNSILNSTNISHKCGDRCTCKFESFTTETEETEHTVVDLHCDSTHEVINGLVVKSWMH